MSLTWFRLWLVSNLVLSYNFSWTRSFEIKFHRNSVKTQDVLIQGIEPEIMVKCANVVWPRKQLVNNGEVINGGKHI